MLFSRLTLLIASFAFVVGAGPAAAQLQYPTSVAVSQTGEIFIGDRDLPGIWKLTDGKLEKFYEGSKKYRTPLHAVTALAFDREGRLLAGDSATRDVYRFDESGKPTPLTGGAVGIPLGIAVGPAGELYVSDLELHTIWKVPAEGGQPDSFAELQGVSGLAIDDQQRIWALARSGRRLVRFDATGQPQVVVNEGVFEFPHNVIVVPDGTAYVTDGYAHAVWKLVPDAAPEKLASGAPLQNPVGVAATDDRLIVADPGAKALLQVTQDGKVTRLFPTEAATSQTNQ